MIGSGSGRRVYDLANGYVVKVARNSKGVAQNKAEYQITLRDTSRIFAEVIAISDNFIYLVMEKATKIKSLSYVREYYNVQSNRQLFQINEIRNFYLNNNLLLPDLIRPANWGVIHGRPVVIDYGFTRSVRHNYY
jgi:hypothetical protein